MASSNKKNKRLIADSQSVSIRVAIAQMNSTVGDFSGNFEKMRSFLKQAKKNRADWVLFPEMAVTGYPPEDLLYKRKFITENKAVLTRLIPHTKGVAVVVGYVEQVGHKLYNSAAILADGKLRAHARKMCLPNYGVFDEKRYFSEGDRPLKIQYNGIGIGITLCEDIWDANGPGRTLSEEGEVDLIFNISSSPWHNGKVEARNAMLKQRARQYDANIVYANLVGGQDELVFDGNSRVLSRRGKPQTEGPSFEEKLICSDIEITPKPKSSKTSATDIRRIKNCKIAVPACYKNSEKPELIKELRQKLDTWEEIYKALVLGTRDYLAKNRFTQAVIGLSGGIDSALTAAIAVDALGAENVIGVMMPSPWSSDHSVNDSKQLAENLKIKVHCLAIKKAMQAYEKILQGLFKGTESGLAEENLQARIRGNLLMALSNKMGWLVLSTGNKSEISVGYCTLYGDMAGGFAPLKDVPNTWVYALSHWINRRDGQSTIPENILHKEPSAELKPGQFDSDSLPPYDVLDRGLALYVENDGGIESLIEAGLSPKDAENISRRVDQNEYKRRQGPPGIKITPRAFGKDRRLPLSNRFQG